MKKYVLNIERLYTGETANALVLKQVDEELPVLLPSMPIEETNIQCWIEKCQETHPEFNPMGVLTREALNEAIMDFNLEMQDKFKGNGHDELYLMDDTQWMNPSPDEETFTSDKVNLHLLNGQMLEKTDDKDENDEPIFRTINTSQLNVLFPFKKVSSKSLHAEKLSVESPYEVDDKMEKSRQMSL